MGELRNGCSTSFLTRLPPARDEARDVTPLLKITASWAELDEPTAPRKHHALVSMGATLELISNADSHATVVEPNEGLQELLHAVEASKLQQLGDSWAGTVILVVPTRTGYFARTQCFQQRLVGCSDLGVFRDRSSFAKQVQPAPGDNVYSLLDSAVLIAAQSQSNPRLRDRATLIHELDARLNYDWLLEDRPRERIMAVVDGHLNLKSYLPFFNSAAALGIKFVLLDSPTHWITDPGLTHLYHHYIPIDMTPDQDFHNRIAAAVKSYGPVDGICAIATYCLLPVAKAAAILGLPTPPPESVACAIDKYATRKLAGGAEPTAQVESVSELDSIIQSESFIPQYPLIVKPLSGTGSAHVFRADTSAELRRAVQQTCEGSKKKALIEGYVDGPELDVNLVVLDGELLFFEIADDFPSPGDNGTIDSDFWENTNVLPSTLPEVEYKAVRESLHELLLKMGLRTGVFHLEARVQHSAMTYTSESGITDLVPRADKQDDSASPPPNCVLIEVNPRPPGMPCILSSEASYGVNMYDLHLLASLADFERYRALSRPFDLDDGGIPNRARAWSQLVWLRADKSGVCSSEDVCGEFLARFSPEDRALVSKSMCFFEGGKRIPELKPGVVLFGAFFVVTSRTNRQDVLRVANMIQRDFSIPVDADADAAATAALSSRGADWSKVGYLHGPEDNFDPVTNPNGFVSLSNAENRFLHDDLADFVNKNNHFDPQTLTYGEGYTGTLRLRTAMARHLDEYFAPARKIDPEEITFTAGVTDLNEVCSLVLADQGEYLLLGGLCYGTFNKDLQMRTGVKIEWVYVGDEDQFTPDCVALYEEGLKKARAAGKKVKALIICNPHNPLGRCYPRETLEALIRFCASNGLHLVSDEIYALSTYTREDRASEKFTSVLSIDYAKLIDPGLVHVLYGMSKDYGAAGLRLGCVVSQNKVFSKAVRAVCRFSSPSQFSMNLAAKFLEDRDFVRQFLQKSHRLLTKSRLLAEEVLRENHIEYYDKGNAGLFIWVNLSPYLPLQETNGDAFAAEKKLWHQFKKAGVWVDAGGEYCASQAGGFRLIFPVPESTLREGIKRILAVLEKQGRQ